MINWMCLFVAGLLEIVWVVALKYAENFSKLLPTAVFVVSIVSSFLLLNFAIRTLPIGLSYAIWTGMGAAGAVAAGIILFGEPTGFWQLLFLSMIVVGIIGINFVSEH
ncbi:multidrug efflux SMR transporter [Opitutia bacterium KCR 482]|nr:multidrug efflux SMR transporter [Opitutae bacterium KCR 482]MDY5582894.1 multidrug efflux SMR transporter [Candidatus Merdousia sp.]